MPDNVGPSGVVGECMGGKWYGGWYGWTFPNGWNGVGAAVTIAAENAARLTGDLEYMDVLRDQLKALMVQGIVRDGVLYVPHRHGDVGWYGDRQYLSDAVLKDAHGDMLWKDGWFQFRRFDAEIPVHLWAMTQNPEDRERIRRLREVDGQD